MESKELILIDFINGDDADILVIMCSRMNWVVIAEIMIKKPPEERFISPSTHLELFDELPNSEFEAKELLLYFE